MPKRKSPRSRRKRSRRPPAPPVAPPLPPASPQAAVATPGAAERAREPSVARFSSRDYTYVRRDLQRIALLASAIIVIIVVLSFFLP